MLRFHFISRFNGSSKGTDILHAQCPAIQTNFQIGLLEGQQTEGPQAVCGRTRATWALASWALAF